MRTLCSWFRAAAIACLFTFSLQADLLSSPSAAEIQGPFFLQPFAFVTVNSVSGGVGQTSSFFSSLPVGSYPTLGVVNILGNFLAFDSMGDAVTSFDIIGVSVTNDGNTFTPPFGDFNFAGNSSVTYSDSLNPLNTITYFATDFTFAFDFKSDPSLTYSYTLDVTGLDAGSTIVFDETEGTVPEPWSCGLLGTILVALYWAKRTRARLT